MKLNETTGLYENYGIWHVPFWQQPLFLLIIKIMAAVCVVLLCVYGIIRYRAYRKLKKLSPWDQAFADLEQLKKGHTVSAAQGKEFYVALSDVLKKYLFGRFSYDVLGKTDMEVLQYLQENEADQQLIGDVQALVEGAQMIKFASAQAAQEQVIHDYERVEALVKRTMPQKKV